MKKILAILLLLISASSFTGTNKTAVISIPKCGNFLMYKLMQMISKKHICISSPYNTTIDWNKNFTITHELVKQNTITFCSDNNIKVIFIYRDPRDQVVSAAYYLKKIGLAEKLTLSELITSLINDSFQWWHAIGVPNTKGTIADFYRLMMEWTHFEFVYATTFEKIIGPQGGGDRTTQLSEIATIAKFCGYSLNEEEIATIADSLWGNSNTATWGNSDTFRLGKIGSWKNEFTLEQKNLFKNVAGQLLIDLGYEQDLNW